jgi:hypothetical protein
MLFDKNLIKALNRGFRISLLFYVIFLCSCTTKNYADEKYPESWADLLFEENGGCLSISGSYNNIGEAASQSDEIVPTLDGAIFSRPALVGKLGSVNIKHEAKSGALKIDLTGKISRQDRNRWASFQEKVYCADGWLILYDKNTSYSEGTFNKSKSNLLFAKDINGNLVVRSQGEITSSSLLLLREKVNIDVWYRFFKIK